MSIDEASSGTDSADRTSGVVVKKSRGVLIRVQFLEQAALIVVLEPRCAAERINDLNQCIVFAIEILPNAAVGSGDNGVPFIRKILQRDIELAIFASRSNAAPRGIVLVVERVSSPIRFLHHSIRDVVAKQLAVSITVSNASQITMVIVAKIKQFAWLSPKSSEEI
ncbi:MAG: hypothetical protein SGJ19_05650 [Planctomycetia bacterium]|nr:hypothetical protein [Planctomycetia bacterium]